MSEWSAWIRHEGGRCRVDTAAVVIPGYRGLPNPGKGIRIEWAAPARRLAWHHDGEDDDIVRYRVKKAPAEAQAIARETA